MTALKVSNVSNNNAQIIDVLKIYHYILLFTCFWLYCKWKKKNYKGG